MVTASTSRNARALVSEHPILSHVDEAFVSQRGVLRCLKPQDQLYRSGEPANALTFLAGGVLQIEYPEMGQERGRAIVLIASPGVLGESQTLFGGEWTGTGVALTDLDAIVFDRESALELVEKFPEATRELYVELAWQFKAAIERRRREPAATPEAQLAGYLSDLVAVFSEAQKDFNGWLPFRQQDLGQATGLRRETVARILGAWQKKNLIELGRGRLHPQPELFDGYQGPSLVARMHPPIA